MAFWGRKRQPPVVSCYGKLPATGDFVRMNAAGPENVAFDGWLGSSLHAARESLGAAFQDCYRPALGVFIYRGDDSSGKEPERGMIGVWASSGDSAGRMYPMTVATSYDYEELLEVGPALPIAVWPFLAHAYDLVSNGRHLTPDEFLRRVAQIQPISLEHPEAARAPYQRWLQQQQMRSLWETGFGAAGARHATLYSVRATLEIFRGHERPQTSLALRFPLGAGDTYAACVWMDLVLRLVGWQRTVLNAFWTPHHDLMVHPGPPQVGTFRELLCNGTDAAHVTDLLRPPSIDETAARERLGPQLSSVLDRADDTIHGFLQQLV
jgi:type VI secretion system protein ImpM